MLTPHDLGRLKQAMLLGLARQPLDVPDPLKPLVERAMPERDAALTVLALAGQQQRFARTTLDRVEALPEAARRLHEDPRNILPEPARRALRRLANGVDKDFADAVLSAAVRRVARAGLRVHPFDLPRLIGHIKGDARCLGLAERAYLALADHSDSANAPHRLDATITRDNWTGFQKVHRIAFLRGERRKNAGAARALLEAVFKSEPAPMRGDLVAALDVGLGVDDLPFLESVAADRAESVRSVAAALIAGVPGTPAYAARLAEAAGCFARSGSGISGMLRRIGLGGREYGGEAAVVFTPPETVNLAVRRERLTTMFTGFSPAEVGAAAGLTAEEVIGAVPANEWVVLTAFFSRAARERDDATLMQLAQAPLMAPAASLHSPAAVLAGLAGHLTEPVSVDFANTLLGSATWQGALERMQDADTPAASKDDRTLVWTAVLLPASRLPSFLETIAPLPPAITRTARDFADLVLALAAAEAAAPSQQR
jgi:Family of unknown function (DUF5691)